MSLGSPPPSSSAGADAPRFPPDRIKFHSENVESTRARLATLRSTATSEQSALTRLEGEKETKTAELEAVEAEIEELRAELEELQRVVEEKTGELEEVRRKGAKSAKVLDKALKEIASCVSGPTMLLVLTGHG